VSRLEDEAVFNTDLTMVMLHGVPLTRRVTEIIDRVFEPVLYNYWEIKEKIKYYAVFLIYISLLLCNFM